MDNNDLECGVTAAIPEHLVAWVRQKARGTNGRHFGHNPLRLDDTVSTLATGCLRGTMDCTWYGMPSKKTADTNRYWYGTEIISRLDWQVDTHEVNGQDGINAGAWYKLGYKKNIQTIRWSPRGDDQNGRLNGTVGFSSPSWLAWLERYRAKDVMKYFWARYQGRGRESH
ncbi:hypothetical protein M0657_010352 [Pyricularia oryzae]|nr:hypothetical protein M0657_010352 [Pyricularia oryzae]KAI7919747.1 hypothetical protein M9X92_006227 [Pyricularia oryzae]